MALPPTIYKAAINLADLDRQIYQQLNLTVARHPSETADRMVARLLAYALCFEDGLSFTKGISAGDEPDLWCKGPDGRITLWIEVGLPDPQRLLKASRHVEQAILLLAGSGRRRWEASHLGKLTAVANLKLLAVEQPFIDQLVERLERGISWNITVTEGTVYLEVAGTTLESQLTLLSA
jgi:uncharacterized protein YaeQ